MSRSELPTRLGLAEECPLLGSFFDELGLAVVRNANVDVSPEEIEDLSRLEYDVSGTATELRVLWCVQGLTWLMEYRTNVASQYTKPVPHLRHLTPKGITSYRCALETYLGTIELLGVELEMKGVPVNLSSAEYWGLQQVINTCYSRNGQMAELPAAVFKALDLGIVYLERASRMAAESLGYLFVSTFNRERHYTFESYIRGLTNISANHWVDTWNKEKSK